jgi:hypothetical protein
MGRLFTRQEVAKLIEAAVAPLRAEMAELNAEISRLKAEVIRLQSENARLGKDSSTSSKPPSSDIIKPPPATQRDKRKKRLGGQPGHKRHVREAFPPEAIDRTETHECPGLGPEWEPLDEFTILQQVELLTKLYEIIEHRARHYRNRRTGDVFVAPFPEELVKAGLVGARLSALIGYQKGSCHMSYGNVERFLDDVLNLKLSRGQLAKVVQKISASLASGYGELADSLRNQPMLNIDGTGHPENGKKLNVWGFHAPGTEGFTFFYIDASRSADVLLEFLGETFSGVIGCDYASEFRRFLKETDAVLQFCWAHLIRDVKFLTTLPDPVTKRFGEKVLDKIKILFRLWHRRESMPAARWQRAVGHARREFLKAVRRAPQRNEAQNIAQRFRDHEAYYFTFLDRAGVEPTNNAMEQRFRFVVLDRKITQGTRGEPGRRWCERIWTTLATCAQRGRSAFVYLSDAISAYFRGEAGPSLLAMPP